MRPGPRRLARGGRPDGEHGLDLARLDGEVHQARAVGPLLPLQRVQHLRSQAPPRERGQAALDRAPRQLVAEAEVAGGDLQHPGELGLRERVDAVAEQLGGELEPDPRGHDGELLECLAALRREPGHAGEDRLDDRGGDGVGGRGQRLGDEERVAAGHPVQGVAVGARARRQPPHRRARERRQRQPPDRPPGQAAQHALERVRRAELVVAEAEDEHGGHRLDPPRDIAEHVDRRVVGPVDVLDDERGRRRGRELGHDRGEDGVDGPVVGERGRQRPARLQRGVAQRAECPRRHQVVARRQQHPRAAGRRSREGADHAGLADPGAAADEHDRPAARGGVLDCADQCGERVVALEQSLVHHPNGPTLGSSRDKMGSGCRFAARAQGVGMSCTCASSSPPLRAPATSPR